MSLRVDTLIFMDTFISPSSLPQHTQFTHTVARVLCCIQGLYSAGSRESGTGSRGKAGGWSGGRCWHKAEECAASRGGRWLWAGLQ